MEPHNIISDWDNILGLAGNFPCLPLKLELLPHSDGRKKYIWSQVGEF
jgi:hypothetical protein